MNANEELISEAYARFLRGDVPGFLSMCDDAMVFEVPGTTPFSGTHTKDGFLDVVGKVMQISGGTFGEQPQLIVANDERGIALVVQWLERDGKRIEYRVDHIWEIKDGKFSRWQERAGDEEAFSRLWS